MKVVAQGSFESSKFRFKEKVSPSKVKKGWRCRAIKIYKRFALNSIKVKQEL
jgi:hypothetical protein